jgi:hypothetical protein
VRSAHCEHPAMGTFEQITVRSAPVVFCDGRAPWVPEYTTVDGVQFFELRADRELCKFVGIPSTERGLKTLPTLVDLRRARNDAHMAAVLQQTGRGDDPFASEELANENHRGAKKRKKLTVDDGSTPKVLTISLNDHPRGVVKVLGNANPNTVVAIELTAENLMYLRQRVHVDLRDAEFERETRKRRDAAPSALVADDGAVKYDERRSVYYFCGRTVGDNGPQCHYRSYRVEKADDPEQAALNHDEAARCAIAGYEEWRERNCADIPPSHDE